MVTNLFSIFDPTSTFILLPNWGFGLGSLVFLPMGYWVSSSRFIFMFKFLEKSLFKEFFILTKNSGVVIIFLALFFYICFVNILGLLPYVFTPSTHLVFTLSLALPLWVGYTVKQWVGWPSESAAHLVPIGTPNLLMPFMVLVESVSVIIRPVTLAVRLAANMIAGHLLLTLLGGVLIPGGMSSSLLIVLMALLTLEIAVAFIQAYVFSMLSALFSSEI